jgi:hypothetical protein
MSFKRFASRLGPASALALTIAACSDAESDDAPEAQAEPAYLLHSAQESPDGDRLNYITAIKDPSEALELDYGRSLELPGRARMYAERGVGYFALGDAEEISITRFELEEDGQFVAGKKLLLQQEGVEYMETQGVLFISATKAYYKDGSQGQIIVWNPQDMTIERVIPLPEEIRREGWETSLGLWAQRERDAFITVGWTSLDYDRVAKGALLIRIDTETDELEVSEDSRCSSMWKTATHKGSLYFFSEVINGFGYTMHGDEGGQQDCILRIREQDKGFDPDYVGSVADALDDNEVGTGLAITEEGRVWYQVVDTEVLDLEPGATYEQWYAKGWTWQDLDLETLSDRNKGEGEPGAYSGSAFAVDAGFFISETAEDYSETTLVKLDDGKRSEGLSFPGFTLGLVQTR